MTTQPSISKKSYQIKNNNAHVEDIIQDKNGNPYAIVTDVMDTK